MTQPESGPRPEMAAPSKIDKWAAELKESSHGGSLADTVAELREYLKLRRLSEMQYRELPDDLREEIGTSDPMDEFIARVGNFDVWEMLNGIYGSELGVEKPKWTLAELEELIDKLK